MKRDMDLVRDILLRIERHDFTDNSSDFDMNFEGFSEGDVMNHIKLLADAGFIEATDASGATDVEYTLEGLTWQGHDFLDAARNQTVWNGTKEAIKSYGGAVPLEVLKGLLIKGASAYFGLG